MRLPEFLINLFTRYAPVEKTTLANLQIEISNIYMKNLNNAEEKTAENAKIEEKLNVLETELKGLDEHTPEYEKKLFEFETLESKLNEPTIFEKIVAFLDKPAVRLFLLISFVFVSRYISKKLTEVKEDKKQDDDFEENEQSHHQNNPPPYYQAPWQPYGYGYVPPHQYQHPANKPNHRF